MMKSESIKGLAEALAKAQGESNALAESVIIPKITNLISPLPHGKRINKIGLKMAFMEKVSFGISDCWYWRGNTNQKGYGSFGKKEKAHRTSWVLFNGVIPPNKFVLHKCDIPGCVNPEHLFLGTNLDNMRDCKEKGRRTIVRHHPEKNPLAKLNVRKVLEMRRLRISQQLTYIEIAKRYDVNYSTAQRAITGITWKIYE